MISKHDKMKHLLIITYDFPPSLYGVRRVLKWIKYLPEFGWKCSVLTVKPVRTPRQDKAPLDRLKKLGTNIYRCGSLDPYRISEIISGEKKGRVQNIAQPSQRSFMSFLRRWIFIPDDRCGWIPFAAWNGVRLVKKIQPDAIITTSYPNSTHVAGLIVKKCTGIPWVADFRDAWTLNPTFYDPATSLHDLIQKKLEKSVAENCDRLITVSKPISDHFRDLLSTSEAEKVTTITNGFDEKDFHSITRENPEKLTFVYTGMLYGATTPVYFLKALKQFIKDDPDSRNNLRVSFYSIVSEDIVGKIKTWNLDNIVDLEGLGSYDEILQEQVNASVLLLFIAPGPSAEVTMTQKVFEYLRSMRPILAMIPEGACRDLLQNQEGIHLTMPEDVQGIENQIRKIYDEWKRGRLDAPVNRDIDEFSRENLTRRLSSRLDDIAETSH